MKIFTQFIILHKNIGFPPEDDFCSFIRDSDNYDSDGDYYFTGIGDFWTNLELTSKDKGKEAKFELSTYRENGYFQLDEYDLKPYLERFRNNFYGPLEGISISDELAVTTLVFSTKNSELYEKFLETTHFFLGYSKGYILNYALLNAEGFKEEFLDK
jgi:hypothetical protein